MIFVMSSDDNLLLSFPEYRNSWCQELCLSQNQFLEALCDFLIVNNFYTFVIYNILVVLILFIINILSCYEYSTFKVKKFTVI